ncbi:hypothetical protein [Coralloluteibacterium stylophorae]|uniref:Tetratricopeptide repeat protein n=1 Tax=Coralloluteibacterium stylophorae TaxID=1776034 RepID=A0A8J7VWR8_9GAMM|nr:hypothetical protein [Coralloluteibacterium stylophorae]MBS7457723.1 hypothetical protein [Coralloluteibacterium stylophorae]
MDKAAPEARTLPNNLLRRWAAALALLLLTAAVYWPGMSGGFIFDDLPSIVDNERLHIETLGPQALARAASSFEPGGLGRPLVMTTFGIDHAIGGLDPRGYKVSGLLVHLINGLLVLALSSRLLRMGGIAASRGGMAATAVALVWATHPLQVSTVLYVVQRMETLSLTFVLVALLAYLRGRAQQMQGSRGWPWLLACVPLVALGLASKETAALFPAFALGLELTLLRFGAASPATARNWRWTYAVFTVGALAAFALLVVPRYANPDSYFIRDFNAAERVLTQLRILPMYLGQILLPLPQTLTFYYDDFSPSRGLLHPLTTALGGALLLGLFGAALALRRRMPLFALGILWFFAAHALTSSVIPLELAFEHRNYFALLGILLAVADLVRRIPMKDGPALKYAAVGAVVCGLCVLTAIRSATWGDPFLLATDLADRNPSSARASNDLAAIYQQMTDGYPNSPFQDFALREFERGAGLPGSSIVSDQGLILTATAAGRPVPDAWWERLIQKLRHGRITPETSMALFGLLGNRYRGVELDDERLTEAFLTLFQRTTLPAHSYAQFGDYLLKYADDPALAERMFAKAVRESADNPAYAQQVVDVLDQEGYREQAAHARGVANEAGIVLR